MMVRMVITMTTHDGDDNDNIHDDNNDVCVVMSAVNGNDNHYILRHLCSHQYFGGKFHTFNTYYCFINSLFLSVHQS